MSRGLRPVLVQVLAIVVSGVMVGSASGSTRPLCDDLSIPCADLASHTTYEGAYTGHDEPALLFYSDRAGSGNDATYRLTLPRDSALQPRQDGTGGVWNFQLHATFWLGMAMCDTESAPESTKVCTPDSDTNIADNPDPSAPDWIGNHAGGAYMELQFYPPGWVAAPTGFSCNANQWCAAMTIDSYNRDEVDNVDNNADCLARVGEEPVNFAYLTTSGAAHSPAGPLEVFSGAQPALAFDPSTDLAMNPGDNLTVSMHDTPAGFQAVINDLTTGGHGSMTAGTANGFAQVIFDPRAKTCTERPYAFHPMFSTSGPHTRVEWTAHSYNVAFSDEIGHFEYCSHIAGNLTCKQGSATESVSDADDNYCLSADESTLVPVTGCLGIDEDFDGPSYLPDWPGSGSPAGRTSEPVRFASPTFAGGRQYSSMAFETDLVNLERHFGYCPNDDISKCTVPPPGVPFYPMFTTGGSKGHCEWREGGVGIPGATNTFGGSPATEWGTPTTLSYPIAPGTTGFFGENFRRVLDTNPCPA